MQFKHKAFHASNLTPNLYSKKEVCGQFRKERIFSPENRTMGNLDRKNMSIGNLDRKNTFVSFFPGKYAM